MAERVVVGRADDISPGERRIVVPFRGRAGIGVFNVHALPRRKLRQRRHRLPCVGSASFRTSPRIACSGGTSRFDLRTDDRCEGAMVPTPGEIFATIAPYPALSQRAFWPVWPK